MWVQRARGVVLKRGPDNLAGDPVPDLAALADARGGQFFQLRHRH